MNNDQQFAFEKSNSETYVCSQRSSFERFDLKFLLKGTLIDNLLSKNQSRHHMRIHKAAILYTLI